MPFGRPGLSWLLSAAACALLAASQAASAGAREDWYLATHNHIESGLSVLLVTREDGSRWVRLLDLGLLGIDSEHLQRSSHAGEAIAAVQSLPVVLHLDALGQRVHFVDPEKGHLPEIGGSELLLDTIVNRQVVTDPQLVQLRDGELFVSTATLEAVGARASTQADEGGWVPVHALAGEMFVLDPEQMRLELTLAPERFAISAIEVGTPATPPPLSPAPLSAIVGYDASVSRDSEGASHQALLLDAAVSAGNIACRSRHLWRSAEGGAERLDTACTVDWQQRALSLNVGDAATRPAVLSAPVRYAGLRFGTDYALQPYLYTQPVLDVDGVARLPSVLEVWIQQQLALRTELPPGPFELDNIPLLTGRGDVEAVVIDALGRRTVISAPFYSDPALLRPGLVDWSIELGRPRAGLLGESDYGDPFGLLTWRRGMSDWLTLQLRGEWREAGGAAAVGGFVNLGGAGVVELAMAASEQEGRAGRAGVLGYSYRGQRWLVGARHVVRNGDYADLAWPLPGLAPRRESQLGVGARLGRTSLSVTAIAREAGNGDEQSLATASLSMPLGRGHLSLQATRTIEPAAGTRYSATWTVPLAGRDSLSARAVHQDGGLQPGLVYQRSAPPGPGYGVRAAWEDNAQGDLLAVDGVLRGNHGQLDASLLHLAGGTSARVGASGAVVATGQGVFAAPDDGGSFALVSLPAPGARVLHDNQLAAVTNDNGTALLNRVRPFERNRISVEVEDLPLTTRIATTDMVVVPGRRQVVRARFEAETVRYLAATLVRSDGRPVAVGATAKIGEASFPVGHGGLLFAELGSEPSGILVARAGQPECSVPLSAIPDPVDPAETYALACEDATHAP